MKTCLALVSILTISLVLLPTHAEPLPPEKISLSLTSKLLSAGPAEKFVVWASFSNRPLAVDGVPRQLPPVSAAYTERVASMPGVKTRFVDELQNAVSIEATAESIFQIADLPFVSRIQEVPVLKLQSHHDAASHGSLATPMSVMDIEPLHEAGYDGSGVRIAFLDSGFDVSHPALAPKASGMIWKDLVNNRPDPYDDIGHGTATASLALGLDTSAPYLGAAYGASLMAIKICVTSFSCFADTFVEGMKFAVNNGARVISASVGDVRDPSGCITRNGTSALATWTGWAVSQGAIVVVSAGNYGLSPCDGLSITTPGDNFNAITVGATDPLGRAVASFSSRGPTQDGRIKPDVVAPGENVWIACLSDCTSGRYKMDSGTSYSTPLVAGVLACIIEKRGWSPATLKAALRRTAFDLEASGPDNVAGFGRVRATLASDSNVDMSFAWDDNFWVETSFAKFRVWDRPTAYGGLISARDMYFHGILAVSSFEVPWVQWGTRDGGWHPVTLNQLMVAGPYVEEATSTSLKFASVYGDVTTRFTFRVQLFEISSNQVLFKAWLSYADVSPSQFNALLYIDFDIEGPCCDNFERLSDSFYYTTETRLAATNLWVKGGATATTRAEVYYQFMDASPYEWLLKHPGNLDPLDLKLFDPDQQLNGESIAGVDVLLAYRSRRSNDVPSQSGDVGPVIYVNTFPSGGDGGGGGSPFLNTFNGLGWYLDNNLMPAAEHSNSQDVTDHYLVQQPLKEVSGKYVLKISEFESAHNFVDQVRLLTVDHSADHKVAVSPTGQVLTYVNPVPAQTATTYKGTDITELLSKPDEVYYQQWQGDSVLLNYSNVPGTGSAKLLIRSDPVGCQPACVKSWFDVSLMAYDGTWVNVADVFPRKFWSYDIIDLGPFLSSTGQHIVVKISFDNAQGHRIDFAGLDTSAPRPVKVTESRLTTAVHSTLGDVTTSVARNDGVYVGIVPGEYMVMTFRATSQKEAARDFVFVVNGHYLPITPA